MAQELRVYYGNNPPNAVCCSVAMNCAARFATHIRTLPSTQTCPAAAAHQSSHQQSRSNTEDKGNRCCQMHYLSSRVERRISDKEGRKHNKAVFILCMIKCFVLRGAKMSVQKFRSPNKDLKKNITISLSNFSKAALPGCRTPQKTNIYRGKKYLLYASNICAEVTNVIITS